MNESSSARIASPAPFLFVAFALPMALARSLLLVAVAILTAFGAGCVGSLAGQGPPPPAMDPFDDAGVSAGGNAPTGLWEPPDAGTGDDPPAADVPPSPGTDGADAALDAGAFAAGEPASVGTSVGASDAPDGACAASLVAGNLEIDELMIESVAGTGDYGEWLEVQSTVDCDLDLRGLHGECAHGATVVTFDVGQDLWLPARGRFVIADSPDPAVNHDLPGTVLGWTGAKGDVLRNDGATVTLTLAGQIIDSLTYPELKLTVGASLAFPSDCDAGARSQWALWQTSKSSWFPGFFGTPNAPNTDVTCSP